MKDQQLESNVDILRKVGIEKILSETHYRKLFHETALAVFGENCVNCDGKIRDKYVQLLNLKTITRMKNGKYKLNDGDVISMNSPDWKEDISNANLTDKKAEQLLNMNLGYIKRFQEAPHLEKLKKLAEQGCKTLKEAKGQKPDEPQADAAPAETADAPPATEAPAATDEAPAEEAKDETSDDQQAAAADQGNLRDELIALPGIGETIADKILNVYPTKDVLLDAVKQDVPMDFLGARENAAKKGLKELK
jgi:predicted flap endonuclease-1-like 5' DNA nuclease